MTIKKKENNLMPTLAPLPSPQTALGVTGAEKRAASSPCHYPTMCHAIWPQSSILGHLLVLER